MIIEFNIGQIAAAYRTMANAYAADRARLNAYLESPGAELTSDGYADLRASVRDAYDIRDAIYLDYHRERRTATATWALVSQGAEIETTLGTGSLVKRHESGGLVRMYQGGEVHRVDLDQIIRVTIA